MFEQLRFAARRLSKSVPGVPIPATPSPRGRREPVSGRIPAGGASPRRRPGRIGRPASLLALPVALLAAGFAEAACENSRRISHRDAECLSAEWKNRGVFQNNSYRVRNMCPAYGKVVAKVDLKMASDRTLHLADGNSRRGSTGHRIRWISCCADIGDLCNRSDLVTAEGCVARFRRSSSAALTCSDATAVPAISGDDYRCTVTARCRRDPRLTGGRVEWRRTSVTVAYTGMGEVRNCDGRLKSMPCGGGLAVGDAVTRDGTGWSLGFGVTLPGPRPEVVRVDYATSDGTAKAGVDYVATRGTLTFAPRETRKTVTVAVIHDDRPENSKTMRLTLSNPRGAPIFHATATGHILDLPVYRPPRWLTGFGRATAAALVDGLGERLTGDDPTPHLALGGHRIRPGPAETAALARENADIDAAGRRGARTMTARDLLAGSSFSIRSGGAGARWSGWGEAAPMRFADGDAGDGAIALVGTDYERGRLSIGVALSRAGAESGGASGARASVFGVHPYARLALGGRLSVWSALGFGTGDLTLAHPRRRAGIGMSMVAAGLRGALRAPEDAGGLALSVKSDAYLMRIASGTAEARGSRIRVLIEGGGGIALGPDRRLSLSAGGGLRHEAGDGAAGTGVGAGAALRYAAPDLDMAAGIGNTADRGGGERGWRLSVSARRESRAGAHGHRLSLSPSWEMEWGGAARREHRIGIRIALPLGPG